MARFVEVSAFYPIPHNWRWDSISNYVKIKSGYPFDSKKFSDDPTGRQPLIRIRDIRRGSTNTFTDEYCPEEYIIHAGDILIGMDGDFNVEKWNSGDALLNQRVCYIQSNSNCLLNDYLYYYLPGVLKIINDATPSVTVKHLSANTLRKTQIPIPPLAEQQRIVDRIESLFTKLDEAKEKAQAVVDSFETRKAAILHKAFTGELTAKWREEHDVGMESWHLRTIGEVCENVKVGIVIKPSQYYVPQNEGTPAFRSANVRECRIDDFDWVYLNEKGMKDNSRSIVHTGDVLVVRSGNPGTACVVPERFDGYNAIDILIAVPNKKIIISDYLCYYTNSPLGKKTVEIGKRGIALTHFNVKGFSQMSINIPTIPEQVVIVRTLGDLFAQEQPAKEAAEAVLDQIDLMKKSILARAFRGELGTNDPNEESAVELLKRTIL